VQPASSRRAAVVTLRCSSQVLAEHPAWTRLFHSRAVISSCSPAACRRKKGPAQGGAEVDVRTNHEGFAALRPGGMERDLPAGGSGGAGLSVGSLRRIACRRGAQNRSGHRPAEPISSIGTGSPRGRARLDRTLQEAIRTKTNLDISYRGSSRIRWVAHAGETAG
jgi:hypothetical protein